MRRSFTKRLPGFYKYSYQTRLKMLGLERLETRRIHTDLIMCYKIIHQLVNTPFDQFFKPAQYSSIRVHPFKLYYLDSRFNVRANFFSVRVVPQ